jgi:hypothetical protein
MTTPALPPGLGERDQQLLDQIESKKATIKQLKIEVRQDMAARTELHTTFEAMVKAGWTPNKTPNRSRRDMRGMVLEYVTEHPGSTIEHMAAVLNATPTQVRIILRTWAEQGAVQRIVDGAAEIWITADATAVIEGPLFREQPE